MCVAHSCVCPQSKNELTAAVLSLTSDLMSFGFFSTKRKIGEVCGPMIHLLDGRGDKILNAPAPFSPLTIEAKPALKLAAPDAVDEFRTEQHYRTAVVGSSRYAPNADTLRVMQCKCNMLSTLNKVANMRAHYRIGNLLATLKDYIDRDIPVIDENNEIIEPFFEAFEDLFTSPEGVALDMEKMSTCPLDTALIDLLMYEDDNLFEASFAFLKRRFGQRRALINFLPKVTLIPTNKIPIFDDFALLDQELQQLRYYMRSYSVWGVSTAASGMDDAVFWRVSNSLTKIVDFLYAPSLAAEEESDLTREARVSSFREAEERAFAKRTPMPMIGFGSPPSFASRGAPNGDHQNILRNLGVAREVLFHGLCIDFDIMSKLNDLNQSEMTHAHAEATSRSREWLYDTCKKVVFALGAFTAQNTDNQQVLFSRLDLLRSKMGVGMFVWDVVITIFENNQDLAEVCPPDLFLQFAEMLNESNDNALCVRHMDFFVNLVQPLKSGRTIARNQGLSLKALTNGTLNNVLAVGLPATGAVLDEILDHDSHDQLALHTKTIRVLAVCAKGRNGTTGAKCQSLVSLRAVSQELAVVGDANATALQTALLQFALYVYVDTPLMEQAAAESAEMWSVLVAASIMAINSYDPDTPRSYLKPDEELLAAAFSLITVFFREIYNSDMDGVHIRNGRRLIKDNMDALFLKIQRGASMSPRKSTGRRMSRRMSNSFGSAAELAAKPGSLSMISNMCQKVCSLLSDGDEAAVAFDPKQALADDDDELIADVPLTQEELKMLMKTDLQGYCDEVMKVLQNSKPVKAALDAKDDQFVALMENCEAMTDPENRDYLEAATGITQSVKSEKEKKMTFSDVCFVYLEFLGGMGVLAVILFLTFGAITITVLQMTAGLDSPIADVIELIVSWVFIVELSTRMIAYAFYHGEIETFVFDPLNDIDIAVVAVDIFLMTSSDSGGGAGLFKALRGMRGFRLLRLFRATRILKLMRLTKSKMTKEDALNDPRSVKVEFKDLCTRILNYVEAHNDSPSHEAVVIQCITFLIRVLDKAERATESNDFSELELFSSSKKELREAREANFVEKQNLLVESGGMAVALRTVSQSKSMIVINSALELGEMLVGHANVIAKELFESLIASEDKDGLFFLAMRDRLRSSCAALVEYRETKEYNLKRAMEFLPEVDKCVLTLKFLRELCEGHSLRLQNLLREQKDSAKTFNLVEEALELLSTQGKSLPLVRQMDDHEGELILNSLEFFVEIMQGPCAENQTFVAENRKIFDVCKNLLSASFPHIKNEGLKWDLHATSMAVLAALLESRDGFDIHFIIIEQLPASIFGRRMKNCKVQLQELGEEGEEELKAVIEGEIRDCYTVTSELEGAGKKSGSPRTFQNLEALLKEVRDEGEGEENKEGAMVSLRGGGWKDVEDGVRCVEVYWNRRVVKNFFTLPAGWKAFSDASKESFLGRADLSNSDSRIKDLMEERKSLYAEMQFQDKLSTSAVYRAMSDNFVLVRRIAYGLVLLLNANVLLTTFEDYDGVSVVEGLEGEDGNGGGGRRWINLVLGGAVLFLYSFSVGYLGVSYAPLAFARSKAARKEMKRKHPGAATKDFEVVWMYVGAIFFGCILCYIHSLDKYALKTSEYVVVGMKLFWLSAPFVLRKFLIAPDGKILGLYASLFDTIMDPPLRNNLILAFFVYWGLWEPYWFTFVLLDILTMSETLQAVVLSVTRPISQLSQTFALFIIVILCYTAVAFHLFGGARFVDDDGAQVCFTLVDCFIYSVYVAGREGDISAVLDGHSEGDEKSEVYRMVFDLTFFVILGVLLFDMVTGVILDTFGALREEIAERQEKMSNESFVSGLLRGFVEELEGNEVEFGKVNEVDQNKWNYLFFAIYLDEKEADEMNGCESYCFECLQGGDNGWVPTKTSWSIENLGAGGMEEEVDVGGELEGLRGDIRGLEKKLDDVLKGLRGE